MTDVKKAPKKKGPIRLEAIVPVLVLCTLTFVYFSYYFDRHLKSMIEYVGTQANGAEVNVASVNTSFFKGAFDLNGLQVTDKEKPSLNTLEIGNMHFQYLWDALLRMKFVVVDASINNIQLSKPRKSPGKVLPPEPAKPSKLTALQDQVIGQVRNKYSKNVLGDVLALVEGGDYKDQLNSIRETLKSEARVKAMVEDVKTKKTFWDGKVKTLSDTSKLKAIETEVNAIKSEKNFVNQVQGVQKLTDLLKQVEGQYKEIQSASKQLQSEVQSVAKYPQELQALVTEDIASLKNRFSIPQINFQEMALHLFAGQFAEYIAKARKYQALAKQYVPEKKEREEVVPPKRSTGKTYHFPITTGYPVFWLQRAAISSTGTKDSYSGKVSGELTNVTTSPKEVGKPLVLDLRGDFHDVKVNGVKAMITIDHTKAVGRQSALIQVASFGVPEKLFVNDDKLKFGFLNAVGSATFKVALADEKLDINWTSALNKPQFLIETKSKLAKEMLTNVVNSIPVINIAGTATGSFSNLEMNITSNLGDELGNGFKREIGLKVAEAQNKLSSLVDEKINKPKAELMAALGGNSANLNSLNGVQDLYKKHEVQIKAEIEKLKKGGTENLKEQGKKLLKGIKF
jgi:uncharacterized protein (TIGR03545 family)